MKGAVDSVPVDSHMPSGVVARSHYMRPAAMGKSDEKSRRLL